MRAVWAAVFAAALATSAYAQDGQTDSSPDIVVTAPDAEVLQSFVGELSAPAHNGQMARWDENICPSVIGMNAAPAQFMIDRLAVRAIELGLTVGGPGCRANVLIYMSRDADGIARQIADHPRLSSRRHGNSRGRRALQEFASTPRPVRWWHVARTVTGDGFYVTRGDSNPTFTRVREASRIRPNVRQDLSKVVVVIDANRINGVRLDTLSDYVAMAALAQIDPDADASALPSVLSVFAGGAANAEAPRELTAWDQAYLHGLYEATRLARSQSQQEADIVRSMQEAPEDGQ